MNKPNYLNHDPNCPWNLDQYPDECCCGTLRPRTAAFDEYVRECKAFIDSIRQPRSLPRRALTQQHQPVGLPTLPRPSG
jgi:hypothetical protein